MGRHLTNSPVYKQIFAFILATKYLLQNARSIFDFLLDLSFSLFGLKYLDFFWAILAPFSTEAGSKAKKQFFMEKMLL